MHRTFLLAIATALAANLAVAQIPDRALTDALGRIYQLRDYTAFDWIAARYERGTLTLQGFARTPDLKKRAEAEARKVGRVEEVVNNIEVLPASQGDDGIRARAYAAIYTSSVLERYAPGGQLSAAARRDLAESGYFGLDAADVGRGPHGIHIIVSAARILLLGEVRNRGDRQVAEGQLRSLGGVLGVVNQLRVAGEK